MEYTENGHKFKFKAGTDFIKGSITYNINKDAICFYLEAPCGSFSSDKMECAVKYALDKFAEALNNSIYALAHD